MKMFFAILACVLLVAAAIYYKASVWGECRQTNSVLYCWQLISK